VNSVKGEKPIVLLLRITTAALVLVPLAAYYVYSGSLTSFLVPEAEFQMPNVRFNVVSYDVSEQGAGYALNLRLSNTGSTTIGLRGLEGKVSLADQGFVGEFSLDSPIELAPGQEGGLNVVLLPELGDLGALGDALSRDAVFNVTGHATIVLGEAELPLSFSVKLRPSEVMGRGGF
jgi:hypothetical protein